MSDMVQKEIEAAILDNGYRFCRVKPEETGVFYKYYQEGFHVVMTIDFMHGYQMSVEQHRIMEERIKSLFFHPQGSIPDFPEGFPVYHVEVITLLVGEDAEQLKRLCAQCLNTWAYLPQTGQLLIYENQPGDFWGLRALLEGLGSESIPHENRNDASHQHFTAPYRRMDTLRKMPYVTIALAAVNIGVFLILELIGDTENGLFIASHGGMHPDLILYANQWWRIFTSGFLHFGLEHLLNNMLILCCVGSRLEKTIGHWRMMLVYVLSEIGGGLLSYFMMLYTEDYAISAGASGAVFGVIGGLLWAVIWNRGRLEGLTTKGMVLMAALSLYFGFTASGVDNWAHVGGILTGFLTTAILYHKRHQRC